MFRGRGQLHRRHPSQEFRLSPDAIEAQAPAELEIHPIGDNHGTHKTASDGVYSEASKSWNPPSVNTPPCIARIRNPSFGPGRRIKFSTASHDTHSALLLSSRADMPRTIGTGDQIARDFAVWQTENEAKFSTRTDRMRTSATIFGTPSVNAKLGAVLVEIRRRLLDLYGGRLVTLMLYGSQARGDAEPGSDIDLMVVLKGLVQPCLEVERSGGILTEVSLHFAELVSCVFVNEQDFATRNTPLLMNVRREVLAVIGKRRSSNFGGPAHFHG